MPGVGDDPGAISRLAFGYLRQRTGLGTLENTGAFLELRADGRSPFDALARRPFDVFDLEVEAVPADAAVITRRRAGREPRPPASAAPGRPRASARDPAPGHRAGSAASNRALVAGRGYDYGSGVGAAAGIAWRRGTRNVLRVPKVRVFVVGR